MHAELPKARCGKESGKAAVRLGIIGDVVANK